MKHYSKYTRTLYISCMCTNLTKISRLYCVKYFLKILKLYIFNNSKKSLRICNQIFYDIVYHKYSITYTKYTLLYLFELL